MLTLSHLTSSHETVSSLIHCIYLRYIKALISYLSQKLCQKMQNKMKTDIRIQRIVNGDKRTGKFTGVGK